MSYLSQRVLYVSLALLLQIVLHKSEPEKNFGCPLLLFMIIANKGLC